MSSELSWKPKRVGPMYCSSGCGGGCQWKDWVRANTQAKQLAKVLGAGWSPEVWENLGWYFAAIHESNHIRVTPSGKRWRAFMGENMPGGRWSACADTPQAAVAETLAQAKVDRDRIQKLIASVEKSARRTKGGK